MEKTVHSTDISEAGEADAISPELLVMINVVLDCHRQPVDDETKRIADETRTSMTRRLLLRLTDVLEKTLRQIGRRRDNMRDSLSSALLFRKSANELADDCIELMRLHVRRITATLSDAVYAGSVLEMWCMATTKTISDWLVASGDVQLTASQADSVSLIAVEYLREFEARRVPDSVLNNNMYQVLADRLQREQLRQQQLTPRAQRRSDVSAMWRPSITTPPAAH
jgi:hypothetical protein